MEMTRRQFGLTIITGLCALLFGRFLNLIRKDSTKVKTGAAPAQFWKRADRLAG